MKKNFLDYFVPAFLVLISIILFRFIFQFYSLGDDIEDLYPERDFERSITGTNYEISIPNKTDPAEFCIQQIPGNYLIQFSALSYFSIQQGDFFYHAVAVDNSIFQVEEEISGCWKILRYEDDFLGRLVNPANNAQIYFSTTDTESQARTEEWGGLLERGWGLAVNLVTLLFMANALFFAASMTWFIAELPSKPLV